MAVKEVFRDEGNRSKTAREEGVCMKGWIETGKDKAREDIDVENLETEDWQTWQRKKNI